MTTSITDARFTSLHFTPGHLLSLSIDDPPEDGWSVMPGYDQSIPIPFEFEPPMLDSDETLPSMIHPSYPYGRPPTMSRPLRPWMNPGNLLGTIGGPSTSGGGAAAWNGNGGYGGSGHGWDELGMESVVEEQHRKEVPPGMAGAKRPPSPPSPALHPSALPPPRSQHLRNLYARQRQLTPPAPADPFDAPVPNETYADEDVPRTQPGDTNTSPVGAMGGIGGGIGGVGVRTGSRGNLGEEELDEDEDEDEGSEGEDE